MGLVSKYIIILTTIYCEPVGVLVIITLLFLMTRYATVITINIWSFNNI